METSDIQSYLPAELLKEKQYSIKELEINILSILREDFNMLVNILYRIDVKESKVKEAFKLHNDTEIAKQLAQLVVERISQKIEIRKKYNS